MKPSPRGRRRERSTTDTRRRATERARDRAKVSRARVYRPSPRSSRHGAVGARDDVPNARRDGSGRFPARTTTGPRVDDARDRERGAEKIVGWEIQRGPGPAHGEV